MNQQCERACFTSIRAVSSMSSSLQVKARALLPVWLNVRSDSMDLLSAGCTPGSHSLHGGCPVRRVNVTAPRDHMSTALV